MVKNPSISYTVDSRGSFYQMSNYYFWFSSKNLLQGSKSYCYAKFSIAFGQSFRGNLGGEGGCFRVKLNMYSVSSLSLILFPLYQQSFTCFTVCSSPSRSTIAAVRIWACICTRCSIFAGQQSTSVQI